MNFFLILAFLFFVGSTIGWVIELFFRRFFSAKRWINPGFLVGPYLPIYGFGVVGLFLLSRINFPVNNEALNICLKLLLMALAMTLIEYLAGLIFIKCMKIKLWDYSDRKFNIQGIICPLFSLIWAWVGVLYYFFVDPYIIGSLMWLANHLAFSFVIGFFYGVFIIDVWYSLKLSVKIRNLANEYGLIIKYEHLKESIRIRASEAKQKIDFFHPLKANESPKDMIMHYIEHIKNRKK